MRGYFNVYLIYSFQNFYYTSRVSQNGSIITNNFVTFREFWYNMRYYFYVKIVSINLDTLGNYIILQLINPKWTYWSVLLFYDKIYINKETWIILIKNPDKINSKKKPSIYRIISRILSFLIYLWYETT